jgi:hypothetical protein
MKSEWDEYVAPYLRTELMDEREKISAQLYRSFRTLDTVEQMKIEMVLLDKLRDKDPVRMRIATILVTDLYKRRVGSTPTFHHFVETTLKEMVDKNEIGITGELALEQIRAIELFEVKGAESFLVKSIGELDGLRQKSRIESREFESMLEVYFRALLTINAAETIPLIKLCFTHDRDHKDISDTGLVERLLNTYWRKLDQNTFGQILSQIIDWEYEERKMICRMIERVGNTLQHEMNKWKKSGLTDLDAKTINQIAFKALGKPA